MNVYDFDGTIYDGDSTIDFYFFVLKKQPIILFRIFVQIYGIICYLLKIHNKTKMKECFFSFLKYTKNIDEIISDFWNKNESKIKKWYLDIHSNDDLIISASPEFLLKEICDRLNISNLIATKVDKYSGETSGNNCYGDEKLNRFRNEFNGEIECFYSDSKSDEPLASIAKESYLVVGDKIIKWK